MVVAHVRQTLGDTAALRPRVDASVDAVYAIAATLLVLELQPPHATEGHLARALLDQWPVYFIYFLGFMQIVGGWCVLRRVSVWSVTSPPGCGCSPSC